MNLHFGNLDMSETHYRHLLDERSARGRLALTAANRAYIAAANCKDRHAAAVWDHAGDIRDCIRLRLLHLAGAPRDGWYQPNHHS